MAEPVFIVGHQRSGTTLLAAMLCAHPRLSCGPETHFFNTLAGNNLAEDDLTCDWPHAAVTFLLAIRHLNKPVVENYGLGPTEIEHYLAGRPPSGTAVLEALTAQYAARLGKPRWVEKTPDHLPLVHLLRCWFPAAPVVRIMRDPRDAALSRVASGWSQTTFSDELQRWVDWHDRSAGFFSTDHRSCTIRYEDLLANPAGILRIVCEVIGEDFEERMLDTSATVQHVNRTNEPWKARVGGPLETTRVGVWKRELSEEQNRAAVALLGDRLLAYGYPCEPAPRADLAALVAERDSLRAELAAVVAERDALRSELAAVSAAWSLRLARLLSWPVASLAQRLRRAPTDNRPSEGPP